MKRVILIILDSLGVGEMHDSLSYGDKDCNTFANVIKNSKNIIIDNFKKLGIGNIKSLNLEPCENPMASIGVCNELSQGKDTITGHLEISGVVTKVPLKTFPNGFTKEIIDEFESKIGRKILGNCVASGTEIIERLGEEHIKTGKPIVYTSADSVFQIAAHEEVISIEELYNMCEIAREMLVGDNLIGRVIARPFVGEVGSFKRTSNRKDYAIDPPGKTMLDYLKEDNKDVISIGKIYDIFNGFGITEKIKTVSNLDGINKTIEVMKKDFNGLLFTNLVDFDMMYGHRNDVEGYANAISEFDSKIPELLENLNEDDLLILTADHGCDPTTQGTDHTREQIPLIVYGKKMKVVDLGVRNSFSDIGKTVLDLFNIKNDLHGVSFKNDILS
ncbi:phosphopentomutase [Candidatus Arthromitus sp. SFB-turkey]|uniref:phosphopentomutase n=1 Tax=Candidatus Arthromitus sp. SFB-turkey TaxID=1840217 RepID=UPI0018D39825|nr:phosphopentomutase [Candidatus Arthromitus sp. SFB-turkey]